MTTDPDPPDVATCMAAMAAGDAAFLFTLLDANRGAIAGMIRHTLRELHRPDLAARSEVVDELLLDVGFVLFERASAWRPDGALPWRWARSAIRARIVEAIGHPTVELDPSGLDTRRDVVERADQAHAPSSRTGQGGGSGLLAELAVVHPDVAVLADALAELTSERNRQVFVEYVIQKASGDPSPSHTVAAEFGLRPAAVRQIHRRTRMALARAARQPGREVLGRFACVGA